MSTDTDRFQSRFKRENRTERAGGARGRRVFEDGVERETSVKPSSGVNISVGSRPSRDRHTDRTDTSRVAGDSITQRMNKLNLKDETNANDVEKEQDERGAKNEEEEADDYSSKKSHKKERGGASVNASRKRQARKNLREKRRSTGVVIMPGQPAVPGDEEEREVQENTAKNMDADTARSAPRPNDAGGNEELLKQLESYEQSIEEWKDELAKARKEIESLRNDNTRLKDENSALLRVVGSLSGTGRK